MESTLRKPSSVYALYHPGSGDVRYVGVTSLAPEARLRKHLKDVAAGRDMHVHRWLRTLNGPPGLRVLEQAHLPWHLMGFLEQWWIAYGRSLRWDLCNLTAGGTGALSAETRLKMSLAKKGKPLSAEHRANLSKAGKGKPAWNKGVPHSDETRAKMSASQTGRVFPEEHRTNLAAAIKKTYAENPEIARERGNKHRGYKMPAEARAVITRKARERERLWRESGNRPTRAPISEETRANMRASQQLRRARERAAQP